jgi:MscS family membrane protein
MKKLSILLVFLAILGFSFSVFGQSQKKVDLSSPNATIYTHIYFLMPDSYDVNKSAATIRGIPREEAREKVIKLKEVLDGNGLRVDFTKVPKNSNYIDTIGIGKQSMDVNENRYAPFPIRMPEVYVEKVGSRWYYSKETVDKIDELYSDTFPIEWAFLDENFPEFFAYTVYGYHIWKPIVTILLILVCILFFYILQPVVYFILKQLGRVLFKKKFSDNSLKITRELARPIVLILIVRFVKRILPSLQMVEWNAILVTGVRIAETVFWIYVFLKIMKFGVNLYEEKNRSGRSKLDRQLAPLVGKVLHGVIVFIGFLHVLTLFGVDPATVLAGASIGGIAVAFAAQDSVKNLIGTLVIFLDKPFQLDDWVVIGGVEGAVEKVGFRSTRMRGADTTIYQIPNSKVVEMEINNKGLRVYRRYTTELGIRYDTPPDLIEDFMEGIKEIIRLHPETKSQSYNVEFVKFADFSLNIMVNVYFKSPDWGMEQASKNVLHLAILRLAEKIGVEFAFPSSTLMIEQLPGQESLATQYGMKKSEISKGVESIMADFEKKDHNIDPEKSKIPGI